MTGWTWASVAGINALFTAFGLPGFTGGENLILDNSANSIWAPIFLDTFLPTYISQDEIAGYIRNPSSVIKPAGVAVVGDDIPFGSFTVDYALISAGTFVNESREDTGGWFYRTEVPLPATLSLLGLGLAALGFSCKKRKVHA